MKALLTIAVLAGLAVPAAASDLDYITVTVDQNLSHWNNGGDGYRVTVSIHNNTPKVWVGVNFECLAYATDGTVVSRAIGSSPEVGAYRSIYDETGLYDFVKVPDSVACRPTAALEARSQ